MALCRRSLPDIKRTIFLKCIEQCQDLTEDKDYFVNTTSGTIKFSNGSEIISMSFADKRYHKFRSVDLSAAIFEELVEISGDDIQAYTETKMRIGRIPHVKEKWIISCTNPGSPSSHWYEYFLTKTSANMRIYYSLTHENPFLPPIYIEQLKRELDPMMAKRMLEGQWLDISKDIIYHQYSRDRNYRAQKYNIVKGLPIIVAYDFNIGLGKPMSVVLGQHHTWSDEWHWFDEIVIHGSRTEDTLDELALKGYLDLEHNPTIEIYGDATGEARSTSSKHSDYDIIRKFLANYQRKDKKVLPFAIKVPRSNPPIRERHNTVNAYCLNALEQVRFYVYEKCATLDKGMRLTALKKGASYIEDDANEYQHATTSVGYAVVYKDRLKGLKPITIS